MIISNSISPRVILSRYERASDDSSDSLDVIQSISFWSRLVLLEPSVQSGRVGGAEGRRPKEARKVNWKIH